MLISIVVQCRKNKIVLQISLSVSKPKNVNEVIQGMGTETVSYVSRVCWVWISMGYGKGSLTVLTEKKMKTTRTSRLSFRFIFVALYAS